ncbi:amino acid/polyamine/organocation transporter (APC superfamily) [Flavobacterium croceum DSM 17960]|uniref:Amino acid/polyamine/organocation transporter (APC superfamily) n=1 Tax=Flavobacterium croceum DSM 17960 TaxID=1121886 RepID=A0A2S4N7B5_9FLAO|nr:amino acid permease [Flavobacterium croceum]POS01604.1 amino acid/polyamine/organocation transporter (APC superfamily) [Flavobacterium croceum DSM 17960]
MNFSNLFRKKTVQDILNQVSKNDSDGHQALGKHLTSKDLTAFGIAAIIGAGIFSTIGKASADGGPAVIFLFIFTAIACSFAAFAYAEFASMVPVSGSAYTYSYVAFGEIIAWIIGWALIMEYAIGNITVAISWSDYFTGLLESGGIHLPQWVQMDYLTASNGFKEATALMNSGKTFANLPESLQFAYTAWTTSPQMGAFHFVADLPALLIIIIITYLVYRGMKESRNASNLMVVVKLCIILLVIAVGIFYVDVDNWHPFAPNGVGGILKGVSAVFFAYIGFDAISTTAEECKNPQRDLPKGMMWAIIICTVLYVIIALVLTGMVKYSDLNVGDPLAFVFDKLNLKWMSGIIAVSAVVAMASVLLVFQMGQPRIWMSMSRDGLLPKRYARVHPKYKTPSYATIVTGFVVAVPALFLNLTMVTDLCSIGTLFAFVLVCAGVLVLQNKPNIPRGKFKTPYINSKYILPVALLVGVLVSFTYFKKETYAFISNEKQVRTPSEIINNLNESEIKALHSYLVPQEKNTLDDMEMLLSKLVDNETYESVITKAPLDENKIFESGFALFKHKIPMWIFLISLIGLVIWSWKQNLSLIPLLGLISCLYMMAQLTIWNWIYFFAWLLIGLIIYFNFGYKNSKLAKST